MFNQSNCSEMLALGRQFSIGTLYNYVDDSIIPNMKMWDSDAVSRSIIVNTKIKKTASVFKKLNGEKYESTLSNLGCDDHSAMSLVAGITHEVGGAWQYVIDQMNGKIGSFNSTGSEVTVHCRCSNKNVSIDPTSQLDMICGQENLIQSQATHVVVAVTYGLEAFCTFPHHHPLDSPVDDDDGLIKKMLDCAQNFATSLLDEKNQLEPYQETEYGEHNPITINFPCVLYSDLLKFNEKQSSWTSSLITEQYDACKKVMDHQQSESVPLKIVLCPLNKLFGINVSPIFKTNITEDLIIRYQMLRELWRQILIETGSLITELDTPNGRDLQPSTIKRKIVIAEKGIKQFQSSLVKVLAEWVISIRRGDSLQQERTAEIIEAIENKSPSFAKVVSEWLHLQRQLIKMLNQLDVLIKSSKIRLVCETEKIAQLLRGNGSARLLIAVLHLPNKSEHKDSFFSVIQRSVDNFSPSLLDCSVGNPVNCRQLYTLGKQFTEWVTENNDFRTVDYVIFYDEQIDASKISPFIQVYRRGTGTAEVIYNNFIIPESPGEVTLVKNRKGVITLTWAREEEDHTYLLQYQKSECDNVELWKSIEHSTNSITINYLESGQTYVFRVAVVTLAGRGPFGPSSENITIDLVCPAPSALQSQRVTDSSIDIAWDHHHNIHQDENGLKISYYSVECWQDGSLEESTLIQRTTTNKNIILEPLILDTTYCIQIRAVCVDSTESIFYSPTSPILKEKTLKEVERAALAIQRISQKCSVDCGIDTFQLPLNKQPNENRSSKICRYAFGKPSHLAFAGKCRRRTVLMLGATGSGKTTLINAMVNYILGVEWEDKFRFKLIDEHTNRSQAHSQTDFVTTYDLYQMKGSRLDYSLTVIDTPGFGDTRGLEKDKIIMEQIQEYFKSHHGIHHLEAVCFVVQSALSRLTATQKYIFDSILSIFDRDMKDNIRLMVTFADNSLPPVLDAIKESGIPSPVDPETGHALHHKFNNAIFFTSNQANRETNEVNQIYFDMASDGFHRFFDDLSQMNSKSLILTREVLEERKRLEALVEGIQIRTQIKRTKIDELENIKKKLEENREQVKANNNFEFEVSFLAAKSVDISGTGQFTTNCQNCKMTCHFPCREASDENKHRCSVMNRDGSCKICKCSSSNHYNQKYRYEMVMEKVGRSSDAIRQQYQKAKAETLTNEELLSKMEQDVDDQEEHLAEMREATYPHIKRLDEIALLPHPFSTPDYIDLMIAAEKQEHRKGYQKRIVNLQKLHQMAEITGNLICDKSTLGYRVADISPAPIVKFFRKTKRKLGRFRIRPSRCYEPFQLFFRTFGLLATSFIIACFSVVAYYNPPFSFFILWCTTTVWNTKRLLHRILRFISNIGIGRIIKQDFTARRIFKFLTHKLGIGWVTLLTVVTLSSFGLLGYKIIILYPKTAVVLSIASYWIKNYSRSFVRRITNALSQNEIVRIICHYRKPIGAVIGLASLFRIYQHQEMFFGSIVFNFVSFVIDLFC